MLVAAWLYATLTLAERRSGLAILLFFSICAAGIPLIHMRGAGLVGGDIANSGGVFFWTWARIAIGATGLVSAMLAARELWKLRQVDGVGSSANVGRSCDER